MGCTSLVFFSRVYVHACEKRPGDEARTAHTITCSLDKHCEQVIVVSMYMTSKANEASQAWVASQWVCNLPGVLKMELERLLLA